MNHIFELSHSTLVRIPFFKILLFALLLGVGRVNGQGVYFGDDWTEMITQDGVNYVLNNYDPSGNFGTSCWFYSDNTGEYYYGSSVIGGIAATSSNWVSTALIPDLLYSVITFNINTLEYSITPADCSSSSNPITLAVTILNSDNLCSDVKLSALSSPGTTNWNYQWLRNGQNISEANSVEYITTASNSSDVYSCQATCNSTGQTFVTNTFTKNPCSSLNYMLVQNVMLTGINTSAGTAQVQFDINWGNAWKDSINWDAAWVFMKYKNAAGEWKHAKINATGYDHGQGTNNIIQPTADKMGAFVRLADYGQTNFSVDGMQLQWNYGIDGVINPSNLELKVFAIEMVNIPNGPFTFCDGERYKLGGLNYSYSVINQRMTPTICVQEQDEWTYESFSDTIRIKGDAGLDINSDGIVDHPNYPTGYNAFYIFKYEMSNQQYADFLNCLNNTQQNIWGLPSGYSSLSFFDGKYYASSPNGAFSAGWQVSQLMLTAYADWSGLRPLSILEYSKALWGSKVPYVSIVSRHYSGSEDVGTAARETYDGSGYNNGSGYFGAKDMMCSLGEPCISLGSYDFSIHVHGDGHLASNTISDISSWQNSNYVVHYITVPRAGTNDDSWYYSYPYSPSYLSYRRGIRLARTAE